MKISKYLAMIVQLSKCTKGHQIAQLKVVNCMKFISWLTEADSENRYSDKTNGQTQNTRFIRVFIFRMNSTSGRHKSNKYVSLFLVFQNKFTKVTLDDGQETVWKLTLSPSWEHTN